MSKEFIESGSAILGIELGSTRIKAMLINDTFSPIATGFAVWENKLADGYWTYSLESIHSTLQAAYKSLEENVFIQYGVPLKKIRAMGVSAMMHGYLPFDKAGNLLTSFRTWRNTSTEKAANELSASFGINIPQRWSVAHLYEAILNGEAHIKDIAHLTTLSGYIHFLLTGKWELGIGDASGMFPIKNGAYDADSLCIFEKLTQKYDLPWKLEEILPEIKPAGTKGTHLTKEGALFLDPIGNLQSGAPICPPEGDAGTGMVATNAVNPFTGNISAGTSIFASVVTGEPLKYANPNIDIVTTPAGDPAAMVHCNNCTGELDAWVNIFFEAAQLAGCKISKDDMYSLLFSDAMEGNTKGIISYNYLSGEHSTKISRGRPMYFRLPEANMNLKNFVKSQLFSTVATLKIGMDFLLKRENLSLKNLYAHGGLFKAKNVAQEILAAALNTPVFTMETAELGGAWGIALLAAYMASESKKSLGDWLEYAVFKNQPVTVAKPNQKLRAEYDAYIEKYVLGLTAEKKLEEII